jgi:hypothetical protein
MASFGAPGFVVVLKKAIWSLRLRLHSGLRQQGRAFGPVVYGPAEAVPFRVVALEELLG